MSDGNGKANHDDIRAVAEAAIRANLKGQAFSDAMRQGLAKLATFVSAAPAIFEAADVLRSDAFSEAQRVYPTGFGELDKLIGGGLVARTALLMCAPTGAGKSGLALTIARHLIAEVPVLYVSTELDRLEVAARVAAGPMRRKPSEILTLEISPSVAAAEVDAIGGAHRIHIQELDVGEVADPIEAIRAAALEVKERAGAIPVIVADYVQQLANDDRAEHARVSASQVARKLRKLSQTLDTPVLGVSSVSRAFYGMSRKTPEGADADDPRNWLASAKESGDLEYSFAFVTYLDTGRPDADGWAPARLIVAKTRRGQPDFVGLRFHGPSGHFEPYGAAVDALGPASRKRASEEAADMRIMARLRKLAEKGREPTRTELLEDCGMGAVPARRAIARLLDSGAVRLEEREGRGGRGSKTRDVIVLGEVSTSPQVPTGRNLTEGRNLGGRGVDLSTQASGSALALTSPPGALSRDDVTSTLSYRKVDETSPQAPPDGGKSRPHEETEGPDIGSSGGQPSEPIAPSKPNAIGSSFDLDDAKWFGGGQ